MAIVNEAFTRRLFGDQNAIGEELRPVLYRSLDQDLSGDPSLMGYSVLVRAACDPAARTVEPAVALRNE